MASKGRFGKYGGQYVPEIVMPVLNQLEEAYNKYKDDPDFLADLRKYYVEYAGRPTLLYYADKLTKHYGGAKIYLKREDLIRILTEPKNALVKQYSALFSYDDVELEFTPEALEVVADSAIERNIGARGLRAVMEGILTQIMFDIPSDPTITKVVITAECARGEAEPQLLRVKAEEGEGESSAENEGADSAS